MVFLMQTSYSWCSHWNMIPGLLLFDPLPYTTRKWSFTDKSTLFYRKVRSWTDPSIELNYPVDTFQLLLPSTQLHAYFPNPLFDRHRFLHFCIPAETGTSILCCFRCVQVFTPPECQRIWTQGVRLWEHNLEFANISALVHPLLSEGLKANSISYWSVLFGRLVGIWILRQD